MGAGSGDMGIGVAPLLCAWFSWELLSLPFETQGLAPVEEGGKGGGSPPGEGD